MEKKENVSINQYDKIANNYSKKQEEMIQRKYIFDPSFLKTLGNVQEKDILDLACGDGQFSRKIKKLGAKTVIGIDISSEMIKIAKKKEKEKPLGIIYKNLNVNKPQIIGQFDIISASFLFHYSKTKEELKKMCEMAYINLKSNGKLLSIGPNPEFPLTPYKKYDFTLEGKLPIKEGDKLITRLYSNEEEICNFYYYHWNKETYTKSLLDAGFKKIKWIKLNISKEGIKKYGLEFWKDFLEKPSVIIIEAKK